MEKKKGGMNIVKCMIYLNENVIIKPINMWYAPMKNWKKRRKKKTWARLKAEVQSTGTLICLQKHLHHIPLTPIHFNFSVNALSSILYEKIFACINHVAIFFCDMIVKCCSSTVKLDYHKTTKLSFFFFF